MSEKSKRRWLRYSLRTLLVLVLVARLPCSWLAVKIRQKEKERGAVEEIGKLGGIVSCDYQGTEAPGPAWMRKLLGVDDQSQAATAQLMGSESAWCVTTGARFPVTDTNGTRLTHRAVVFFNFPYSGGLWQFDTDGTFLFG